MTPFFKSKFFKFCAFMLALVAVSTPFWLFNSTQSVVTTNKQQSNALNQEPIDAAIDTPIVDTQNSKTTGTIELSSLENSKDSHKASTTPSPAKAQSPSKAQSQSTAPAQASTAPAPGQAQGSDQAKGQSSAQEAASSSLEPVKQQGSTQIKEQSLAQGSEQARDKGQDQTKSQGLSLGLGHGQSHDQGQGLGQDAKRPQESLSQKLADTREQIKESDANAVNKDSKVLTSSVEPSQLQEQVISSKDELKEAVKPMTLAQKVKAITEAQTKEQKAQYQRSIEERQEMVDAAIASIAQNSKMYLPPMISSRALVVTFSVPVANADLSDDQDHGIDATTGATVIKYDNKVDGVMSFIANRLNQESGADLYYITPTTQYPKKQKKLYQFALSELTDKNYPELTDDVPLHLERYDTIYLCYPIWWDDMPAAIYSFLIKYDLSDKTIIPVCLHSGDEFANTISTITTYEPHAIIYKKGLAISTKESLNSNYINNKIRSFLSNLAVDFN